MIVCREMTRVLRGGGDAINCKVNSQVGATQSLLLAASLQFSPLTSFIGDSSEVLKTRPAATVPAVWQVCCTYDLELVQASLAVANHQLRHLLM